MTKDKAIEIESRINTAIMALESAQVHATADNGINGQPTDEVIEVLAETLARAKHVRAICQMIIRS